MKLNVLGLEKIQKTLFFDFIKENDFLQILPDIGVCKLQTKILKTPIFGNATSRHANFTKFCRNVTVGVRNEP